MNKNSMKTNYVYNMIYEVFLLIIPLFVTPYVSRMLLEDGLGQYSFSYSVVSYFVLFGNFGFNIYSQREIANYQNDYQKQKISFWEMIFCRMIFVFISLIFYGAFLLFEAFPGKYFVLLLILSLNIVNVAVDIAFFFRGNDEFGKLVLRSVIIKSLGIALTFICVKKTEDVWVYTLIQSLTLLISSFSLWFFLPKDYYKIPFNYLYITRHIPGALKLFLPAIAASTYAMLDKTLIGVITQSDAQNGMYDQAEKLVKMGLVCVTSLGSVMITRNSDELSRGNINNFKNNISLSIRFCFFIGIPIMFGLAAISDNFSPWYFGTGFELVPVLIKMFAPIILITGLSNILGTTYLIPLGRDNLYVISVMTGAVVNCVLNVIMINFWGCIGAAIATISAEFVELIVMLFFARGEIKILDEIKCNIHYIISGIMMFLLCYFIQMKLTPTFGHSLVIVMIGAVVYCTCLIIVKDAILSQVVSGIIKKIMKGGRK